jgi:23S rRNA (adenine2503-C2)-methyltransferase
VNLIPYNPTGMFEDSSREAIETFRRELERARIPATVRLTRGRDIEAACGQLASAPRQSNVNRVTVRGKSRSHA